MMFHDNFDWIIKNKFKIIDWIRIVDICNLGLLNLKEFFKYLKWHSFYPHLSFQIPMSFFLGQMMSLLPFMSIGLSVSAIHKYIFDLESHCGNLQWNSYEENLLFQIPTIQLLIVIILISYIHNEKHPRARVGQCDAPESTCLINRSRFSRDITCDCCMPLCMTSVAWIFILEGKKHFTLVFGNWVPLALQKSISGFAE